MKEQDELIELYNQHWVAVSKVIDDYPGLSGPILIKITEEYLNSKSRLFIIGQQTFGWDKGNIPELLSTYEEFNFGEKYYSSPFWNVIRQIENLIGISPYSIAWTNLNKCDYNNERPNVEIENKLQKAFPVLENEIRILKPNLLIFFTGPDYDANLLNTLPETSFSKMNNYDEIKLLKVNNSVCPPHSYRTYHPNYLRRSGKETKFIEFIKEIGV